MTATLQGAAAFVGVADRVALRAEVVALQRPVLRLTAFRDRAPWTRATAPGTVGATERVDAVLVALAVDRLEGDVVDTAQAARHQDVADHALLRIDVKRCAVDVVAEIVRRAWLEFEQGRAPRESGKRRQRVGSLLGEHAFVLALPVALLHATVVAAAERGGERHGEEERLQARSCASDARCSAVASHVAWYCAWSTPSISGAPARRRSRKAGGSSKRRKCTAAVFSSFSRSRSSSAIARMRAAPSACTQTRRSIPLSRSSMRRRSSSSGNSTNMVAFQLLPSGMS